MKFARLIKSNLEGYRGIANLYYLEDTKKYIVISGAVGLCFGPETYIFKSNKNGEVKGWTALDGSFKGEINHLKALNLHGYHLLK